MFSTHSIRRALNAFSARLRYQAHGAAALGRGKRTIVKPDGTVIIPKALEITVDKSKPVTMYVTKKTLKIRAFDKTFRGWEKGSKVQSETYEMLSGVRTVKIFAMEKY